MSRGVLLCVVVAVVGCLPQVASADPLTLVSGRITYNWGDNAFFGDVAGPGVSVSGQFGIGGSSEAYYPPYASCTDCAGRAINPSLTESFVGLDGQDDRFVSILVGVGGQYYLSSAMSFAIDAGNVMVPSSIEGSPNIYSTSAPFRFSGWIEGQPWSFEAGTLGGPVRRFNLTGAGNVQLSFGENHWWTSTYSFTAAQNPAPVPEPGTMLLVGAGVLGAVRRVARSRRAAV
jgi:hypothetical protein